MSSLLYITTMKYIYNYKEEDIDINSLQEPKLIKYSKTYTFLLYKDLEASYTILCNNILASVFLEEMYNKLTGENVREIEDRLVTDDPELIYNLLNIIQDELFNNRQEC